MHPVTSELDLATRQYEREVELQSIQREFLAREAARIAGRPGLASRLFHVARRLFDPRGYALQQAMLIESPTRRTPKSSTEVASFPEPSRDTARKAA